MTEKIKINLSEIMALPKEEIATFVNHALKIRESNKTKTLEHYLENANDGQMQFHKAPHRMRLMFSGNRGGKTTAGCNEIIMRATGRHPYRQLKTPRKQLVIAMDFENHVKKTLEGKFTQWAPLGSIVKTERNQNGAWRTITWSTGSITDFASQDQDIKIFEGSDYDDAWFDEPCPQAIFNAVWRGLTDRGGDLWMTGTPITHPWVYNQLWVPSKDKTNKLIWAINYSTNLNAKNIGEGDSELGLKRIKEFADQLPPEERAARLDGEFLQMQGLIFKGWNRAHHLIPHFSWPQEWPIWESIDPHPSKPWAVSWIGISGNGKKILIRSGLFEGVIDEIADQILHGRSQLDIQNDRPPRIVRSLIDNAASVPLMQRSHSDPTARRRSVREELEALIGPRYGGPPVTVAPKNVKSKIDLLKMLLHISLVDNKPDSGFYVLDTTENERFVYEIENYIWDARRGGITQGLKDTPRKIDDDILDTVMQTILTLPKEEISHQILRTSQGNSYRV